jgi:hypothetical protein
LDHISSSSSFATNNRYNNNDKSRSSRSQAVVVGQSFFQKPGIENNNRLWAKLHRERERERRVTAHREKSVSKWAGLGWAVLCLMGTEARQTKAGA